MNKLSDWLKKKTDTSPEKKDSGDKPSNTPVKPSTNPPQQQHQTGKNHQKHHPQRPQHHTKQHPKQHPQQQSQQRNDQRQSAPLPQKNQRFKGNKLLKIIPIAGLDEVGKNMNAIEYGEEIVTIDCGLQFPEPGMLGIDYVIPDTTYLQQNKRKVKAMLITHGHLDHIGGLRHILPKLGFPPVYGSALTIGMIEKHLEEYKLNKQATLKVIKNHQPFRIGSFEVEFFAQNHSIPDSNGIVLRTPVGVIVHTGDYKFDFTPAWGECADFQKLAQIGSQGVLALMGESTNAPMPGHTTSEKVIAEVLENIIEKAKGRVIIASFSSLMGRIGQILDIAHKYGRKVFISGRSMMNNIEIGVSLGYLKPPKGVLMDIRKDNKSHPHHKSIILCTGSQGEGLSALNRVALNEHKDIRLTPGDTIVLSSNPIIGNEKAVISMINNLLRQGVNVITNKELEVHTSGHAKQDELKLMLKLMTPKFLIPVHGEYLLRHAHKHLAMEIGMEENQIIMAENGDIIETDGHTMRKSKSKVPANNIFIDGTREGEGHQSKVMLDRQVMSENGVIIVVFRVNNDTGKLIANPGIDSRGLLYLTDTPDIHHKCVEAAKKAYEQCHARKENSADTKLEIKRAVGKEIMQMVKRNPIIMPIIVKV
ncbi:MAG: ribonuclease J [Candidatus Gracilibacteria bacterium]|nr:ribonuclease J [bacterium]MDZ4216848.1 ribonuclease J [Candidatus Gracilibacteria bacterium]